jgi:threonine synthase
LKAALSNDAAKNGSGSFLKRWLDILPINNIELIDRVSIGESETPLVRSSNLARQTGIKDLRFKLEFLSPTLSLKDRGISLCALKALELGYDTLCIPSSGNNAASVAAYAAKSGLRGIVFIQKKVSPSKILKIISYGAKVVRVDGDMSTASRICEQMIKRHHWFHCGGVNPYNCTAKRTAAYEIIEQLGGSVPDAVIFPAGGATGIASAYTAFLEMKKMDVIGFLPRLIGVQLEACDPVTSAFNKDLQEIRPVITKSSLSDALMNNSPSSGTQALKAARETGGMFVSVSDKEFVNAIHLLASKEGLFTEPAGAVSFAGLTKLIAQGRLQNLNTVVCMLTGHGLNSPDIAKEVNEIPELIDPEVSSIENYLDT